jgi:ABC-2 type transport system permease protein
MSTQSTAIPESSGAPPVVLAAISTPRPFYWSVRREFWENRSIYLAPLAIAGVFLFGFLISLVHLPAKVRVLPALSLAKQYIAIGQPYEVAAGVMMITTILVSVFYCLDALHGERRDRSILFWKSLPVSDLTTVLAKAIVPIIILPVITSVVGAVLQLIMLLLSSAVLLGSGLSAGVLWTQLPWFHMSLLLLYHMLTAHGLWPAPIYGYLLLVSGWARRATFLWATLPVVAIAGIEALAFHTSHFITLVGRRFIGDLAVHPHMPGGVFPTNPMTHITPATFLGSPGLWIGLAITAAFLAAAVQLRRHQGPI